MRECLCRAGKINTVGFILTGKKIEYSLLKSIVWFWKVGNTWGNVSAVMDDV